MKSKNWSLRATLLGALLSVAALSAVAANTNGTGVPKDPGPVPFGNWVGVYKFIQPHYGPDGRYYTFTYVTVTGTTQAYCQQQIPTNGNVIVVQSCQPA
ncbi:hypothetical protein [Undibacterium flavidum]|uniref:Secreted protein n=1 Tax=Undibacterium flavidum TaxID=2762297 RepID=A0ABR6Y782_9BURK|nr:hypothetical protein [Undibacterium flavidum]MBC3872459.1 hypothetical protein [Undibacterium flavidum]